MAIQLKTVDKRVLRETVPLEQITADVKQALEEALEYCAANPGKALVAEFGTQDKAVDFLHELRSYAKQREPKVVVSGNATKSGNVRFDVHPAVEA